MSQIIFIQGEQIDLLVKNIEHINIYLKWENNPIIRKYQDVKFPITLEIMKKKYFLNVRDEKKITFEIWHKKDEIPIGLIDFHGICSIRRRAEIYICIGEIEYWGKGIGTEAIDLILNYGFNTLNYRKIIAKVNENNKRSLKMFKKADFIGKRHLRRHLKKERMFIDGKWTTVKLLTITNKNYKLK